MRGDDEVLTYFEKLRTASVARDSLLCVGLDPDQHLISGGLSGAVNFCRKLIDVTADLACCYKPNAAFLGAVWPSGLARFVNGQEVSTAGHTRPS